jgi:hypothetical protein
MITDEEIARIRVNEAIQLGVRSQSVHRDLGADSRPVSRASLMLLFLALLLTLSMLACFGSAIMAQQPVLALAATL